MSDLERLQKQVDELLAFKRYAEPLLHRYEETVGGPQPPYDIDNGGILPLDYPIHLKYKP